MVTLAEVKLALGYDPDSGQEIRFEDGTRRVLRIRDIAASVPALEARERIKAEMFPSAGLGAMSGGGLIGLFLVAFWWRGARLGRQKRIRGAEMVTAKELRRRLQSPHERVLGACPEAGVSAPTPSRASRIRSAPRPSTPSSRAPRARARPC